MFQNLADFLQQLELMCATDQLEILLKKPDKKKEKYVCFVQNWHCWGSNYVKCVTVGKHCLVVTMPLLYGIGKVGKTNPIQKVFQWHKGFVESALLLLEGLFYAGIKCVIC